jgi:hypothetical protein
MDTSNPIVELNFSIYFDLKISLLLAIKNKNTVHIIMLSMSNPLLSIENMSKEIHKLILKTILTKKNQNTYKLNI